MLTRAEATMRDRIRDALDLQDLCRQFSAATDIAICCLSPGEIRTYTTDLMALRQHTQAIHYKDCRLPAGFFRPRPGERVEECHHHHGA